MGKDETMIAVHFVDGRLRDMLGQKHDPVRLDGTSEDLYGISAVAELPTDMGPRLRCRRDDRHCEMVVGDEPLNIDWDLRPERRLARGENTGSDKGARGNPTTDEIRICERRSDVKNSSKSPAAEPLFVSARLAQRMPASRHEEAVAEADEHDCSKIRPQSSAQHSRKR